MGEGQDAATGAWGEVTGEWKPGDGNESTGEFVQLLSRSDSNLQVLPCCGLVGGDFVASSGLLLGEQAPDLLLAAGEEALLFCPSEPSFPSLSFVWAAAAFSALRHLARRF